MARPTASELEEQKEQLDELVSTAEKLIAGIRESSETVASQMKTAEQQANSVEEQLNAATESKKAAETAAGEIEGIKEGAGKQQETINELVQQCQELKERLDGQATRTEEIQGEADRVRMTIEHHLPDATSAGLAAAFYKRKKAFETPKKTWGAVFVASMCAFFLVVYFNPLTFERGGFYTSIFAYVLERLPFVVPIVWLAIYAGRRHSQALRLEEEYAHKEALSNSFEGYKTQIREIEGDDNRETTLKFITSTLEALALHPGRIYVGKHEDVHPFGVVKDALSREKEGGSEQ